MSCTVRGEDKWIKRKSKRAKRKRERREKCKELHILQKLFLLMGPKFVEIIATTAKVQYRGAFFFGKLLHTARKLHPARWPPQKYCYFEKIIFYFSEFLSEN